MLCACVPCVLDRNKRSYIPYCIHHYNYPSIFAYLIQHAYKKIRPQIKHKKCSFECLYTKWIRKYWYIDIWKVYKSLRHAREICRLNSKTDDVIYYSGSDWNFFPWRNNFQAKTVILKVIHLCVFYSLWNWPIEAANRLIFGMAQTQNPASLCRLTFSLGSVWLLALPRRTPASNHDQEV